MKYKLLNGNADDAKTFKENYYKMLELNDKLWRLDNCLDMVQTHLNYFIDDTYVSNIQLTKTQGSFFREIKIDDNELSKHLTTIYKNHLIDEKLNLMNEIDKVIFEMQNFKYEEE